ncbi:MAG: permease [Candidatus Zixiibacteriota bacterium]
MSWKSEWKSLVLIAGVFLAFYLLPIDSPRIGKSLLEALALTQWYAREHVLLCLIPAFFIAGAIGVFVSQESVMKYLGAKANKILAYAVASVSGSILAVCSCTVLPLFAGIYRMGAGIGPASAFLYSGPAINVLAIIMTARILGLELGIARAVGAVVFSIIIGLAMHFIFRKEEAAREGMQIQMPDSQSARPLWQTAVFFALQIAVLVFATWSSPKEGGGFFASIFAIKWLLTGLAAIGLAVVLNRWLKISLWKIGSGAALVLSSAILFHDRPLIAFVVGIAVLSLLTMSDKGEGGEWFAQSWGFARQILPLLFAGVLVAGFLLGRPGEEALIPPEWISSAVGGNSLGANLFASVAGALMYFATLTEVPILQGLIGSGMGKGPALALLLAGPALSLPSMLVLHGIMGSKKLIVYIALVVVMSTITGLIFGSIYG